MEFRKKVKQESYDFEIMHQSAMVSLGSCFAESIGLKLKQARFDILQNPFGIIFNPIPLGNLILSSDFQIFEQNNVWKSWNTQGVLKGISENDLKNQLHQTQQKLLEQLANAEVVLVTFGTAFGYELKSTNSVVANCHKMPQDLFDKKLSTVNEIVEKWKSILDKYPKVNWVFTVSPVRHWKDGVRENNVSKGILHQAIHQLLELPNAHYFNAYEILLDELRDYRFYKNDYLHPSEEAVEYIWEHFRASFFSTLTNETVKQVEQLNKMEQHSILNEAAQEVEKFVEKKKRLAEIIENKLRKA